MARHMKCPGCGAEGSVAPCDEIVFQTRGRLDGTRIAKCMKCGRGLAFGAFSGLFFGKPKLVLPEIWQQLEGLWRKDFGDEA